jgi:hypothetical protein
MIILGVDRKTEFMAAVLSPSSNQKNHQIKVRWRSL